MIVLLFQIATIDYFKGSAALWMQIYVNITIKRVLAEACMYYVPPVC